VSSAALRAIIAATYPNARIVEPEPGPTASPETFAEGVTPSAEAMARKYGGVTLSESSEALIRKYGGTRATPAPAAPAQDIQAVQIQIGNDRRTRTVLVDLNLGQVVAEQG
jgi:hypothetical protein